MSTRWDNHFLRLAQVHAEMSKDPNTRVGAVIVGPDREIRATGFNGFPRRICDDPVRLQDRETKLQLVVHAECNAICAAARVGVPLLGCTLYLAATDDTGAVWGGPPCTRCTVTFTHWSFCGSSRPSRVIAMRSWPLFKIGRAHV